MAKVIPIRPSSDVYDRPGDGISGLPVLAASVAAMAVGLALAGRGIVEVAHHGRAAGGASLYGAGVFLISLGIAAAAGLTPVALGEARVVQLFGRYVGTMRQQDIVPLDDERKAAMVSNLLVVLCSDQAIQPVVNVGSLYQ